MGLAGLAAVAVVGGTGYAVTRPHSDASSAGTSPSASSSPVASGSTSGSPAACPATAQLAVDPAWAPEVSAAADAWGASFSSSCHPVTVDATTSGDVAHNGLGKSVAWIPEDPAWQAKVADRTLAAAKTTPIATSPLVVVHQKEAGEALGLPLQQDTLRKMITLEDSWAGHGHPEWGWMKVVLPDPATSVAGAVGFAGLTGVGSNGASLPTDVTKATSDQLNLPRAQQRIVARAGLTDVVDQLAAHPADANGRTPAGPRTGVTTEALALHASNLRAGYLDDHSGITMTMVSPAANATVDAFTTWLTGKDGAKALAASGVHAQGENPDENALRQLGLEGKAPTVRPNTATFVTQSQALLSRFSRRTSALLVLDTSGSMSQPLAGTPGRRIDAVTNLLLDTWDDWPPGTTSGMMTFHSDENRKAVIQTVVPLQRDDTRQWVEALPRFRTALNGVQTFGGTPLYEAILSAWRYNTAHYTEGDTNRIVVVTDGRDEDTVGSITLAQLLANLPKKPDAKRPIQVTYVALGPDADFKTLKAIADATGQQALQVSSVAEMHGKIAGLMAP